MRILYITYSFQHPLMRGSTRHYYFVRELSQRHRITLLALTQTPISDAARKEMEQYTERIFTVGSTDSPSRGLLAGAKALPMVGRKMERALRTRKAVRQMRRVFIQLVEQGNYDLVLFHGKLVSDVIRNWRGLPLVVDFCDATSLRLRTEMQYAAPIRRSWLGLRHWQMIQVEKRLVQSTPHLAFISNRDRDAILGSDSRSQVIPNGVDLSYWRRQSTDLKQEGLIFTGVMDYAPNHDAALQLVERIVPLVRRSIPNLPVLIVGRDPSPKLIDCARRYADVLVTGFVDDLRPYLERAALYVAPLRSASGMQNKLLEAMAMEIPVVTTPIAAAGLGVDQGAPPVCVASGPEELADCIIKILRKPEEGSRLAVGGRRFVEKHFVWSKSAEKLEQLCFEACAGRQNDT